MDGKRVALTNHVVNDPREAPSPESAARSPHGTLEDGFPKHSLSGFEWKTRAGLFHIPLICISYGRDLQGKIRVARGFLAVGQIAVGGIAIGPFAVGIMSIGLFSIGVLALGVLALGLTGGRADSVRGPCNWTGCRRRLRAGSNRLGQVPLVPGQD